MIDTHLSATAAIVLPPRHVDTRHDRCGCHVGYEGRFARLSVPARTTAPTRSRCYPCRFPGRRIAVSDLPVPHPPGAGSHEPEAPEPRSGHPPCPHATGFDVIPPRPGATGAGTTCSVVLRPPSISGRPILDSARPSYGSYPPTGHSRHLPITSGTATPSAADPRRPCRRHPTDQPQPYPPCGRLSESDHAHFKPAGGWP